MTRKTRPVSWIKSALKEVEMFQTGWLKTPKRDIDLIKDRIKRLKETLR